MEQPPPIEWQDVHNHLISTLQIEPEWIADGQQHLIWQPHIVPVHVEVAHEGHYPDGDSFLVVKAWARVAQCGREEGLALAEEGNNRFLLGSFSWEEDTSTTPFRDKSGSWACGRGRVSRCAS